jgi:hypothetical protein
MVTFQYLRARSGPVQQGEILADVWEHRVVDPATELGDRGAQIASERHPLLMAVTPDCDLLWDFDVRFPDFEVQRTYTAAAGIEIHGKYMAHVLVCDAFAEKEIRNARGMNSTTWRDVTRNKDDRYHTLRAARVGDPLHDGG